MEPDKLYEIKKKYGSIFTASIKGQDIVFRELTFNEYDQIVEYQNSEDYTSLDSEDLVIKYAVVYPEDFSIDKLPPGIVSSLAKQIVDVSGFYSARLAKNILQEKRDSAGEVRNLMKAFVLATINSYSPEKLDEMTFSQLAEKVALSEKIIEIQQSIYGIEPTNVTLQLIDPEEEKIKEQQAAARHDLSKKEGEAQYSDPIAKKLWGAG